MTMQQSPKLTSGNDFFAVELPVPTEEQVRAYQALTRNGELTWAEAIAALPPEEAAALAGPPEALEQAAGQPDGPVQEPEHTQAERPAEIGEAVPHAVRFLGRDFTVARAVTNAGFPRIDGDLFIAPVIEFTKVLDATSARWDVILWSRNIQTPSRQRSALAPQVDDPAVALDSIVSTGAGQAAGMPSSEPAFKAIGKFFYRTLMFRRAPKGLRPGSLTDGGGSALHYFEFARIFHVNLPPSYGVIAWRLIIGRFTFLLT
jgi:hypothetical protein